MACALQLRRVCKQLTPFSQSGRKERNDMRLDLSLTNEELYKGCMIRQREGRLNLETPRKLAAPIVKENIARIIKEIPSEERAVELTGRMATWVYLIALPIVLGSFEQVWFDDGQERMLIAP